jgi:hypothetical protein
MDVSEEDKAINQCKMSVSFVLIELKAFLMCSMGLECDSDGWSH